jgi:hypothetical protein
MDEDLYNRLKRRLPRKRISAFINEAVRAHLYPDAKTLDAAYKAARRERWRDDVSKAWRSTEAENWPE